MRNTRKISPRKDAKESKKGSLNVQNDGEDEKSVKHGPGRFSIK